MEAKGSKLSRKGSKRVSHHFPRKQFQEFSKLSHTQRSAENDCDDFAANYPRLLLEAVRRIPHHAEPLLPTPAESCKLPNYCKLSEPRKTIDWKYLKQLEEAEARNPFDYPGLLPLPTAHAPSIPTRIQQTVHKRNQQTVIWGKRDLAREKKVSSNETTASEENAQAHETQGSSPFPTETNEALSYKSDDSSSIKDFEKHAHFLKIGEQQNNKLLNFVKNEENEMMERQRWVDIGEDADSITQEKELPLPKWQEHLKTEGMAYTESRPQVAGKEGLQKDLLEYASALNKKENAMSTKLQKQALIDKEKAAKLSEPSQAADGYFLLSILFHFLSKISKFTVPCKVEKRESAGLKKERYMEISAHLKDKVAEILSGAVQQDSDKLRYKAQEVVHKSQCDIKPAEKLHIPLIRQKPCDGRSALIPVEPNTFRLCEKDMTPTFGFRDYEKQYRLTAPLPPYFTHESNLKGFPFVKVPFWPYCAIDRRLLRSRTNLGTLCHEAYKRLNPDSTPIQYPSGGEYGEISPYYSCDLVSDEGVIANAAVDDSETVRGHNGGANDEIIGYNDFELASSAEAMDGDKSNSCRWKGDYGEWEESKGWGVGFEVEKESTNSAVLVNHDSFNGDKFDQSITQAETTRKNFGHLQKKGTAEFFSAALPKPESYPRSGNKKNCSIERPNNQAAFSSHPKGNKQYRHLTPFAGINMKTGTESVSRNVSNFSNPIHNIQQSQNSYPLLHPNTNSSIGNLYSQGQPARSPYNHNTVQLHWSQPLPHTFAYWYAPPSQNLCGFQKINSWQHRTAAQPNYITNRSPTPWHFAPSNKSVIHSYPHSLQHQNVTPFHNSPVGCGTSKFNPITVHHDGFKALNSPPIINGTESGNFFQNRTKLEQLKYPQTNHSQPTRKVPESVHHLGPQTNRYHKQQNDTVTKKTLNSPPKIKNAWHNVASDCPKVDAHEIRIVKALDKMLEKSLGIRRSKGYYSKGCTFFDPPPFLVNDKKTVAYYVRGCMYFTPVSFVGNLDDFIETSERSPEKSCPLNIW